MKPSFTSDNASSVHPKILKALTQANTGFAKAYGFDPWTQKALLMFKKIFGNKAEAFLVPSGTGANVLGLSTAVRPGELVFVSDQSHLFWDESGAPERGVQAKFLPLPSQNGKIFPDDAERWLRLRGDQHRSQPRAVSLTQSTECGTVYTLEELKIWGKFCKKNNLLFHIDGTRLANALVTLDISAKKLITQAQIDLLSFGGTKNGLLYGEAVIFFKPELSQRFPWIRKSGLQLLSKMRYMGAQFVEYLKDDLWLKNAQTSNQLAQKLALAIESLKAYKILYPVQANAVFLLIPQSQIKILEREFDFYIWDIEPGRLGSLAKPALKTQDPVLVRLMTAFDTHPGWIKQFAQRLQSSACRKPYS